MLVGIYRLMQFQGLVASEAQNLMKTHVLDEITKHLDEHIKKN